MKTILRRGGSIAVCESHGAELQSCRVGGRELLWNGDPAVWAGHAPLLFPIVGGLRDGTVRAAGRDCAIPKHGFAKYSDFALSAAGDDWAEYVLRESPDTLAVYPFPFRLTVRHTLTDTGFRTDYTVTNTGASPLPYAIGGHPAVFCGDIERFRLEFPEEEDCTLFRTDSRGMLSGLTAGRLTGRTLPLRYADYETGARIAFSLRSRSVTLAALDGSLRLRLDFAGFSVLTVWTPPKKRAPFLCLEPWNGCPALASESGSFTNKPFVRTLSPRESHTDGYCVLVV